MSPENTRALIDIYPELFSELDPRSCMRLFGFECGNGWFELLKDLITEIKAICDRGNLVSCIGLDDEPSQPKVNQVKEKYGALRFYMNWTTDAIEEAIDKAEDRSSVTCERCGVPGELRKLGGYWYVTYCDD